MYRTDLQKGRNTPATGSIFDVANKRGESISSILAEADVIVIFDRSGSMGERVGMQTKHDLALKALEGLQAKFQGRVAIVQFDHEASFVLGGRPFPPGGSTNLTEALNKAKPFDGTGMKFIVISDGVPDNMESALQIARTFTDPIDTIFIGNDFDKAGIDFLRRLASGESLGHTDVHLLEKKMTTLLLGPASGQ